MGRPNTRKQSQMQACTPVQSFSLVRHSDRKELSILPANVDPVNISPRDIYRFRCCASSAQKKLQNTGAPRSVPHIRCGLVLSIHRCALGEFAALFETLGDSDARDVSDVVMIELAHGLFNMSTEVPISPDTILYVVQMLVARLVHLLPNAHGKSGSRHFEDWQLAELSQSFRLAIERGASIGFIARRLRLSVCHFSRLFKATYGLPFHRFLINERIKRAQSLLVSTTDAIVEIALESGFADQSSFTRRFTAVSGCPPAAWRRRLGLCKVMVINRDAASDHSQGAYSQL